MLYFRCPTCNRLLANIQCVYEYELEKGAGNEILSKCKLLYCCKLRIITYVREERLIKSLVSDKVYQENNGSEKKTI